MQLKMRSSVAFSPVQQLSSYHSGPRSGRGRVPVARERMKPGDQPKTEGEEFQKDPADGSGMCRAHGIPYNQISCQPQSSLLLECDCLGDKFAGLGDMLDGSIFRAGVVLFLLDVVVSLVQQLDSLV